MSGKTTITPVESLATGTITKHIVTMRNHKVLLDADLAELYGVQTKVLVQAVKRNVDRFPGDFMFQLDAEEWKILRSQSVTSSVKHGGRRYPPFAFTEQGVAMLGRQTAHGWLRQHGNTGNIIRVSSRSRAHNRVGGDVAITALSHHRTCGSAYGGSSNTLEAVQGFLQRD